MVALIDNHGQAFDTASAPEVSEFSVIPAGEYRAEIVATQERDGKQPPEKYLELQVKVEGQGIIFDRLFLWYQDAEFVSKNVAKLGEIERAIGMRCGDSDDMLLKPVMIKVVVEPPKGTYGESNRITKYFPVSSTPPMQQVQVPPSAPIATTAAPAPTTPTPMAAPTSQPVWRQG
tara:strand:- start:646 stop:1170 length:525 start_codon:yes stop_codon:yes gene_type:complete